METASGEAPAATRPPASLRTVILASSTGTAFEWYDFFVYGSLTAIISRNFFSQLDETAGTLAALALFAAGLLFRPVGALIFGRIGDRFGRKGAFLSTVIMMGGATFAIGLLPDNHLVGGASTIALIVLRILQGMAVGGEYGGAAIYVAEHASAERRGAITGWIQSSAAYGLVGALGLVLLTRTLIGEDAMAAWGWRVPFLASAILLAISIWMRLKLDESPEFVRMRKEGQVSRAPFAEAFLRWSNLKYVLIAIVALFFSQGPLWYCIFFYSQVFLESFAKVQGAWSNAIMIGAVVVSIPFYVFFAWLSDRIGRKPVLLFGMALATVAIFPSFHAFANGANHALVEAQKRAPITVVADPATCTFKIDLLGRSKPKSGCDIARNLLTRAGVNYRNQAASAGSPTTVHIGDVSVSAADGDGVDVQALSTRTKDIDQKIKGALETSGYPKSADPAAFNWPLLIAPFVVLIIAATALYGPMAAALVELFPTSVRYTALSVPYHLGIGVVGGFMPASAFAIATATGNIFAGLWYPVAFGAVATLCCLLFFPETRGRELTRVSS
ncbi:MAG: MFS transporter [Alphaproteobacteria bacterium]|nr:MFS transporter [Alphaproteobacteria bacterium]